jgi:hypothetical protein
MPDFCKNTIDAVTNFDSILKYLLPLLTAGAAILGVRGDTWDKEKKQPKPAGYGVIALAIAIGIISFATWWADHRISDCDKARAVSDQTTVSDKLQKANVGLQNANDSLRTANASLDSANTALSTSIATEDNALFFALQQLPVDRFEVWLKREEIKRILPRELAMDRLHFQKPPVSFSKIEESDDPTALIENRGKWDGEKLSFASGKEAIAAFKPLFDSLCDFEITPLNSDVFIGGLRRESQLIGAELNPKFMVLSFHSDELRAGHFANNRLGLGYLAPSYVCFTGSSCENDKWNPPSCLLPREMKLRITSFGLSGDTGFFRPDWNAKNGPLSPKIVLIPNSAGQKTPIKSNAPTTPNTTFRHQP